MKGEMGSPYNFLISMLMCLALIQLHTNGAEAGAAKDPTQGFISLPLKTSSFEIQKPYNLPVSDRYSFKDGVHTLWVLSTDKPHFPASHTSPRTEIRILGHDYSSGVWQFEGHAFVPKGTSGVSIMQIFGASPTATTLMLHVYNGVLMYYRKQVVAQDIYDKWFRVNVIHDVGASQVKVFIDGALKLTVTGRGGTNHFFKFGVYAQRDASHFMESRWKGIKVMKKM